MSSFRIRPRFKHIVDGKKEELEQMISSRLEEQKQFIFNQLPDHLYIKIHPKEQHFWSPQLHLSFEQEEENVIIRGLYGPNPTLWAVFFFSYVTIGLLTLFIGMWGLTRWNLGMDSSILWVIPGLGIIAIVLYAASQAGQKLGAQQMFDIHHLYEEITKDKVLVN